MSDWAEKEAETIEYGEPRSAEETVSVIASALRAAYERDRAWIPVTDRLPCNSVPMLVWSLWNGRWDTRIAWHTGDSWAWDEESGPDRVTHWMPRPDPPQRETGDQ